MQLTKIAADKVKKNRRCINLIALAMDAHSGTVERWLKENESDGDLTKAKVVEIISEEIGLAQEEILTEE